MVINFERRIELARENCEMARSPVDKINTAIHFAVIQEKKESEEKEEFDIELFLSHQN